MNKIKLFYSYSHKDEEHRDELEKHLVVLRKDEIIDEWHDRKIGAGNDQDEEIVKHIESAHVILLLFSPDFLASDSCKIELEKALQLRNEKQAEIIPIILRWCAWKDTEVSSLLALPKDGKPITNWNDKDEAWKNVYEKIKEKVKGIRMKIKPVIKNDFKDNLLTNPTINGALDNLFVYPDILKNNDDLQLENDEIDSEQLTDLDAFGYRYILIRGEEQSGKSSLCNMLYKHYLDAGSYPVLINGKNISGKADLKQIVNEQYNIQYSHAGEYWSLTKEVRILLVDDADEKTTKNFSKFISSIQEYFGYSIVFIDELSNLSDRSREHNDFPNFELFSLCRLGHRKRDELIKKCIAHDENIDFDTNNLTQLKRLDRDTKHINTIIGTNIVPSYPVFIVTIFHVVDAAIPTDFSQTSYGHCYHAMVTMNLDRAGIKPEDIDAYFNFLMELAYFMFNEKSKAITEKELAQFIEQYKKKYITPEKIIQKLEQANIVKRKSDLYSFQYVYIYYYFVARFMAKKMDIVTVKNQTLELMKNTHKKDNANIIIFITHHTRDKLLLDEITLNAMSIFEQFPEATLSGDEKKLIKGLSENLRNIQLPDYKHTVEGERNNNLEKMDEIEPVRDEIEEYEEQSDEPLLIEIRKSAKNIEIIGQILKNHYGSLEKDRLKELFEEGQHVGLRLLRSFIVLMLKEGDALESLFESLLDGIRTNGRSLSTEERNKESQKIVARFTYDVILGWLYKIVNSLGYDKLVDIADEVNINEKTIASNLINLSIHAWYTKKLDIEKVRLLYLELERDNNQQAIYILKDIVSHYIYMHPINYRDKQKINSYLGFSVQNQISVQRKLGKR